MDAAKLHLGSITDGSVKFVQEVWYVSDAAIDRLEEWKPEIAETGRFAGIQFLRCQIIASNPVQIGK